MAHSERHIVINKKYHWLVLAVLLAATLACSAPSIQPAGTETPTPVPATATPTATPTIAPTPTITAGWQTYHDDTLKLTLAYPSGWAAGSPDASTIEIDQADGDGWFELDVVAGAGDNPFGLGYTAGEGGDALVAALLTAAKQDGIYPDAQPVTTRIGPLAWVSEGQSVVHNEQTLIAAIGLPDRALIFTGHGSQKPEDWPALSTIYRGIIASLESG